MVPIWIDETLRKGVSIAPQGRYDEISEFLYNLATPNPIFLKERGNLPLIERNPVAVWRGVSGILFLINIALIYLLNS